MRAEGLIPHPRWPRLVSRGGLAILDTPTYLTRANAAQCLKDETMGESVARVWRPGRLVVHYNGSFHTDFRLGTAERAQRRVPNASMIVVTALPVANLDRLRPSKEDRKRANYLLYVLASPSAARADSAQR